MSVGTVYWMTGLSGTGKTTLGRIFYERLKQAGRLAVFLDGNELREVLAEDLSHDVTDRKKSAMRNARLCKLLSDQGLDVVCATISLWHECQHWNRSHISSYREIHVRAPLKVLIHRDHRRIYRQTENVWGVHLKPEEPQHPDWIIDNDGSRAPEQIVDDLCGQFLPNRTVSS